jgi:hypothetical protein
MRVAGLRGRLMRQPCMHQEGLGKEVKGREVKVQVMALQ